MAKFNSSKKKDKITFRIDDFEKLLLDSFFEKNKVLNKSQKIREILIKYIVR